MPLALTDDHLALASTVAEVLEKRQALAAARALLEAEAEALPPFWQDAVDLGWLGLHVPEAHGGAGYGLPELAIVVEQLGRFVAPGPFVPTAVASAVIALAGDEALQADLLPRLTDGTLVAGVGLSTDAVIGGGLAGIVLLPSGDDVAVVDVAVAGATLETPPNLDPTRRSARIGVDLDGVGVRVLPGARQLLVDVTRLLLAAEAAGVARACTDEAAEYAKVRQQFGRPIGMFQAVKHHCADMLVAAELATAAVWDAARAASAGGEQLTFAAAAAADLAGPAADLCANLNTQVHGGIAITWEHDAHLYLRRATALRTLLDPDGAARDIVDLSRKGVVRVRNVDLPPEAEAIRDEVRALVAELQQLDADGQKALLIERGYAMPHWPAPWGRGAGAVEQLVIEQELGAAGIKRPSYGITGWNILTLIQHGTEDQVARWVAPALRQEVIWCQLFSEPDAGSDAAGVKTKATRVDGGWLVNGQKVWTSGAHVSGKGLATVRTNPDAPKHQGITCMVIDMHAPGVTVRPLRQTSGGSDFNEVFLDDVFVPDDDVVGPVDGGWTVARATLGNESVSIGGGEGGLTYPGEALVAPYDAHPERLYGGAARVGRYIARQEAMRLLNLRSAHRAVAGGEPGPEGAVTKLVMSELGHEIAAILAELHGADTLYMDGPAFIGNNLVLMHRAMSIAGGTSEIKRNQIGERILGLPRDPLVR
jgi:alkylation response protein AidB-like acyl-CoA dehydrogenase